MNVFAISFYAPPQLTPQAVQVGRQLYHLDAQVTLLHGRDPQFADRYDQYPDFFKRVIPLEVPDPGPPLTGQWHRAALRALPLYGAKRWRAHCPRSARAAPTCWPASACR